MEDPIEEHRKSVKERKHCLKIAASIQTKSLSELFHNADMIQQRIYGEKNP